MPKPLLYVLAFLAVSAVLSGAAWFIYEAGADSVRVDYADKLEQARQDIRAEFEARQAAVTNIETDGRDSAAERATAADALAEEINHADLSEEPNRGVDHANTDMVTVRCVDPFGPEYYRMLQRIRGGETAAADTARVVPRTD